MPDNAVIYGDYAKSLTAIAANEGLIGKIDIPLDDEAPPETIAAHDARVIAHALKDQQEIYQTLLIYDKITILQASPEYDYGLLMKSYPIDVMTVDDVPETIGYIDSQDEFIRAHADLFRPWALPHLIQFYHNSRSLRSATKAARRPLKDVVEQLYDACFSDDWSASIARGLGTRFIEALQDDLIDSVLSFSDRYPSDTPFEMRLKAVTTGLLLFPIQAAVGSLMTMSEIAQERSAVVVQREFVPVHFGELTEAHFTHHERSQSYKCVRLACETLLGELPEIRDFEDVLELRSERESDVLQLRAALSRIDHAVRAADMNRCLAASFEVQSAVAGLNSGRKGSKVAEWGTWLTLPVAAAEALAGIPPALGISVAFAGTVGQAVAKANQTAHSWVHVVR